MTPRGVGAEKKNCMQSKTTIFLRIQFAGRNNKSLQKFHEKEKKKILKKMQRREEEKKKKLISLEASRSIVGEY